MKNLRVFRLFVVLLSAVILGGIVSSASAQPAEANALEWREIPIKNIRPDMLAYWIAPAHHPKPVEYQKADNYVRQSLSPKQMVAPPKATSGESSSTGVLEAPPSVSAIFADDENNVIWVRSTPGGFDQLKQIVEFLDRPIRKIDFVIKLIELNSVDAAPLQSDPTLKRLFEPVAPLGNVSVSQELKSTLANLIKTGDAKVIKSSQIVILNNLTDRFTTATSTSVTVDIRHADDGKQILTTQTDKDNPLFMEKRLSLVLTPTVNNDDTITIYANVTANAELIRKTSANDDLLWVKSLDNQKRVTTVFTIHNGGSILFTGYNSTMLGLDNQNHPVALLVKAQVEK